MFNAGIIAQYVSGGDPWTPAELTPLTWHDSSVGSSVYLNFPIQPATNGDFALYWQDQSGNAHDLAFPVGAANGGATYQTNVQNGLSSILWPGTRAGTNDRQLLRTLSNITNTPSDITVTALFRPDTASIDAIDRGVFSIHPGLTVSSQGYANVILRNDLTNNMRSITESDAAGADRSNINPASSPTQGDWNMVLTSRASGSQQLYLNTVAATPATQPNQASLANARLWVGHYFDLIGDAYAFKGYIAEVITITRILTTDERERLEGYWAHKWGITSLLPALHPYKTNPPTI